LFLVELPAVEPEPESKKVDRNSSAKSTAVYQAARWIRRFHNLSHVHIGVMDHTPAVTAIEVLNKYGFVQTPIIELNRIRLLLETYGPLLISAPLFHQQLNATMLPLPDLLFHSNTFEDMDHAIVVNGYSDGMETRLLYRDPAYPEKQFVIRYTKLKERMRPGLLLYVNCDSFPKPCAHIASSRKTLKSL
jgi:hypothetical protein